MEFTEPNQIMRIWSARKLHLAANTDMDHRCYDDIISHKNNEYSTYTSRYGKTNRNTTQPDDTKMVTSSQIFRC